MDVFNIMVLAIMIAGAIAAARTKNLLGAVIIFMVYSLMMAILWQRMNAPDLAITEAAVGAGITSILFIVTLRKIKGMKK
ncbi:MAG: energy-converting hydrogenase subunit [Clostridiales bacterium]|nr:energy-converting hydrogenase subunit [Clostridiales bacterium]MDN5298593.1 energy-converting hydrogenase subunit [Clostridiales bacterium]